MLNKFIKKFPKKINNFRFRNFSTIQNNNIKIFDTTLRDGEQSPGATLIYNEKLQIAKQLSILGVDICEAGFPISSPGDFESVKAIAQEVGNIERENMEPMCIAGLSRAIEKDIDAVYNSVKYAKNPRIHIFIATSDIHLKYKLKLSYTECIKNAINAIEYAKSLCNDVEFSCEDAGRTNIEFLKTICEEAIKAGATTINLPDTVGYMMPFEYGNMFNYIKYNVKDSKNIILSTHCHNDLGLATANTLSAIKSGAKQIEVTINGIGERAGNTSLEEVVMALKTRNDCFNKIENNIKTTEIYKTSQMVSNFTGMIVQPNKAIVGKNAFAHEAGIHQDGVLKNAETYEIMTPQSIGLENNDLVLGKHSGRNAFIDKLKKLEINLDEKNIKKYFKEFKKLCDEKKYISDNEIIELCKNKLIL